MSQTIEHIAQAIYGDYAAVVPWDCAHPGLQNWCRARAREVLMGIREAFSEPHNKARPWEAMIDEALK